MAAIGPPNGWVSVGTGAGDAANRTSCANLLNGCTDDSSTTLTGDKLLHLLQRTYNEPNAPAGSKKQPLFYLFYFANYGGICVAFYKTLKTPGGAPTTSTGSVAPTKRWWCITVGVEQQPATGWSYPYVKSICTYFYYVIMNPSFQEILVTAEDYNRQMDGGVYEVDACFGKLADDDLVFQNDPGGIPQPENGYPPWTKLLQQGSQIYFSQLTL
jgi:hypothetical protein